MHFVHWWRNNSETSLWRIFLELSWFLLPITRYDDVFFLVVRMVLSVYVIMVVEIENMMHHLSPVKRICVFEHSVMTNFNCTCPAIQRGQGSGFLSEGSSWLTACMSEQRRFWRDCADLAWTFAARIGDKYQIRLSRSILCAFSATMSVV